MFRTSVALAALLAAATMTTPMSASAQENPAAPTEAEVEALDLWLEEVHGDRALAWVEEHNQQSLDVLQGDPRYQVLYDEALEILQATDRIPSPGFTPGGHIDNFWQDANHVRGIWRRTTLDSYQSGDTQWETILDIDALAEAEGENWVYKGASCLPPDERYCLISLSDGGRDAVTVREFDSVERRFVDGGFVIPESKSDLTWIDRDTLLVGTDWGGDGDMTDSGYPNTVRVLRRGQALDQAQEIFRGQTTDVSSSSYTLRNADGELQATLINRGITFYEGQTFLVNEDLSTTQLPMPTRSSIRGFLHGRILFETNEDWTAPSGQSFASGDLIAWNLNALRADPATAVPELVLHPGERDAIEGVTLTRNELVVALFENVRGSVYVLRPQEGVAEWSRTRLDLPENVTVGLGSADSESDRLFVNVSGYLNPNSLWLADAATGAVEQVRSLPARFDASGMIVEQFQATSADGTLIPYFVVHRQDMPLDGSNPTLLYGYGGFQNSLLPGYSGTVGRLWLSRGGVYVIANTRGGGEFGPRWHQAALQENRQRAHEDFQAVALDLLARNITSQPHLGVMGGSQGGLFMGAMLTQRPDLINAAVIQVPLFDMLRFHRLLAGASWIAEYGNPDIPEQRAWIEAYSPYQNLRAGQPYPEVFIHTSTADDRVHPGHARRAAARLEELGYPVLYFENTDGGHAAGANLLHTARRIALEYTYLSRRLMDTPAQE
ncbi:prolyl oligopeptidase family serine peptidase [Brevundimonas aveniformis]|uniref:prolyl oligopeptidase family serine peptidase n=1 Tax=Brevundimonas aveniformis TaxID=370977 RepID=UPI000417D581|nr:prolyl oligopeptidase family serine peptidase [Brevundimonas aveniformis]